MEKILLFYKYVTLPSAKQIMKWQRKLCTDLDLVGRIVLASEGINGTLAGSVENVERYKKIMDEHELFGNIDWKEGAGGKDCFPRMRIVVKDEITHLGLDTQKFTAQDGGIHLKPKETHELLQQKPEDLVVFDARNNFEWAIGTFENAILPDIRHFRDLPEYIDNNTDLFKDKQVLMFCTGGIRCERASTYLKSKGVAKKVYQMDGGIHRYTEKYPDGFFRGKNYVFDGRIAVKVNEDILGTCSLCETKCDNYTNCFNALCNKHFIGCQPCLDTFENTCSQDCQKLLQTKQVHARPQRVVAKQYQ